MTIKFSLAVTDDERCDAIIKRLEETCSTAKVDVEDAVSCLGDTLPHITIEAAPSMIPSICLAFFHAGIKHGQNAIT